MVHCLRCRTLTVVANEGGSMSNFWIGFWVGVVFEATIGTIIAMNIENVWKKRGWYRYKSGPPGQ